MPPAQGEDPLKAFPLDTKVHLNFHSGCFHLLVQSISLCMYCNNIEANIFHGSCIKYFQLREYFQVFAQTAAHSSVSIVTALLNDHHNDCL